MLQSAPGSGCRCSASLGAPQRRGREWTPGVVIVPWQASFVRADKASLDVLRWALVDQTLLTAAILNLAINARNAMPNGGTQEDRRLADAQFELGHDSPAR